MPMIQNIVTIAAADVSDNVLAGSQWEFLPYDAFLEFGLNGDANGADLRVDVYSGQDVLLENSPMNTQARLPVYPDDYSLNDVAAAGERLKIRVRNTHATLTRDLYFGIRITPAG